MDKPDILLINLNRDEQISDVVRLLDRHCQLRCLTDPSDIAASIQERAPLCICFEYDYPDIPGLAALQETKLLYPSIPIIMTTGQHSEALAVWAFRSRVWDYFTKPLPIDEILECFRTIQALPRKGQQAPRKFALRRCAQPADTRFQPSNKARDTKVVRDAITYVERNLHGKISQADVADVTGLSCSQFSRVFKQVHGTTFQEYVLQRRISETIRLMQNPDISITDICYTVGFNDQSHFNRIFNRYVGVSPSTYRKNLGKAHASLLPHASNL